MCINDLAPLDKSYCVRMAMLDLLAGKDDTFKFLEAWSDRSSDLESVFQIHKRRTESATLFRFMTFAAWKFGREDLFMSKAGTLKHRQVCDDPSIVALSQEELLKLDHGTSQWASAAAICGDSQRIAAAPAKLLLTYRVINDWENDCREYQLDPTILAQMKAFVRFVETGRMEFEAVHSEDYCFARAFGLMDAAEGELRWSSLKGHESNRIEEMERAIWQVEAGEIVTSSDHRVVQAIAMMWSRAQFSNSSCVSKSWPRFWAFWAAAIKRATAVV